MKAFEKQTNRGEEVSFRGGEKTETGAKGEEEKIVDEEVRVSMAMEWDYCGLCDSWSMELISIPIGCLEDDESIFGF